MALAKQEKGFLFTTDYNLGKVAEIEGLKVLNVNGLAQSLRPVILPGETLEVKVIQRGSGEVDDDNVAKRAWDAFWSWAILIPTWKTRRISDIFHVFR